MTLMRLLSVVIVFAGMTPYALADGGLEAKKKKATVAALEVITMRSTLARNFVAVQKDITEDTVISVCNAVSSESETIMKRDNLTIKYAAVKYRDAKNAATPEEAALLEVFEKDRKLRQQWDEVKSGGKEYLRYSRPIFIEKACLACHGARDKRPTFIVEKYPDDKAYDYNVGDLRGIISVIVPE